MSSSTQTFEHAFYVGNYMSGILYGAELVMYFYTISFLSGNYSPMMTVRARRFFMWFSTILLLLLTIDISVNAVWGQMMWINGREAPGGVEGFIRDNIAVWYQTLGSTTVVMMIFMGDALLLYRLFIIYGSSFKVIALPATMYIVSFVLSILQLVVSFRPGGNFFHGRSIDIGTPCYALTISFNLIVTFLICIRLHRLGKAVSRALGRDNAVMYTSAASMFVESAGAYSVVGLVFLVCYALGRQDAVAFGQVWAKLTCIAPQLIVLRIAAGRAWAREVVSRAESQIELDSRGLSFGVGGRAVSTGVEVHTHISIDADRSTSIVHGHIPGGFGTVTGHIPNHHLLNGSGGGDGGLERKSGHTLDSGVTGSTAVDVIDVEKWAEDARSFSESCHAKIAEAF